MCEIMVVEVKAMFAKTPFETFLRNKHIVLDVQNGPMHGQNHLLTFWIKGLHPALVACGDVREIQGQSGEETQLTAEFTPRGTLVDGKVPKYFFE